MLVSAHLVFGVPFAKAALPAGAACASAPSPMNLPNSITLSRIATVPLLIWILSPAFPGAHAAHGLAGGRQELLASGVFILASITDGLDGYLARKRKQITTLGMLLDPLADKLMVTAA
jgi:CDP-diacylglycerol---glycerol-3-phosphate 3-phosphatidyltransferase